uniref:Uncharacterized protein n=1 Tax=Cacopsylla melanoneura TaxID=428564 RepID=A0A8D8RCW1_9HEMI
MESTVSTKKMVNIRRIHLVEVKGDKDLRVLFTKLKTENNMLQEGKKVTTAVSVTETRNIVRKTMKIIFHEENMEMDFFVPKNTSLQHKKLSLEKKDRKHEAVVIKTNVSTYADIMRSIRSVFEPENVGVNVGPIKLNKHNNVVIETDDGQAGILHKEIATRIQGIETKVVGQNTTVDIDASMNGKQIEDCIRKETREFETVVRNVRTARSGTQVATVIMSQTAADKLLKNGDIKIGMIGRTRCRVKPKVDIIRCFNCLKMGQHSAICRDTLFL